jgi:electron transport complex protein RnfG
VKEILRLVVVLGIICAVSGLSLAAIHQVTKKPIELQLLKNVQGPALVKVLGEFGAEAAGPDKLENDPIADNFKLPAGTDKKGRPVEKAIFPAKKDGKLMAVALDGVGKGFDGNISVMVGINPEGTLTGVAVMKHTETPGIGSKIMEPKFTDQFSGKALADATKVDGVSGATYSTRGVFAAVEQAVDFYQQHKDEILAQAGK